jgi:hypothetical protein
VRSWLHRARRGGTGLPSAAASTFDLLDELTDRSGLAGRAADRAHGGIRPRAPVWINAPPVAEDADWHRPLMRGSVAATLIEMKAPTKLSTAEIATATFGFSAPVAIEVAIAFAGS